MGFLNEKHLYVATEDLLGEVTALRLIQESGAWPHVGPCMGKKGNSYLQENIGKFVRLAKNMPVLLITDLDMNSCPAALRAGWLERVPRSERLLFRVAVREVEAWVLADREKFAEFSGAPPPEVPLDPEALPDPKAELLRLIRRYSPRRLREEMTSSQGRGRGAGYNPRLTEFVRSEWRPEFASNASPSLARARRRIRELAHQPA